MDIRYDVHESFNREKWTQEALPYGDIWIGAENPVIVERKTWDDAYNSWQSNRLDSQITEILKHTDKGIILIEGKLNNSWIWRNKKNYSATKGLQTYLNRINLEVMPVIYTDSKNDTIKWCEKIHERIVKEDFGIFIRKVKVLKSSRNKYHNIMSLIPQITLERSKKLYDHFNSLQDFINNIEEALEIDEKTRWKNQVGKIKEFIESPWGETKEREVIVDKTTERKI